MPNLLILDIAIGLAMIYAILALACTAANEIVAQLVGMRARTLVKGIRQLVGDPKIAAELLRHPLIAALGKNGQGDKSDGQHPSYLPGNLFALALIDTVAGQNGKLDLAAFRAALQNNATPGDLKRILTLLGDSAADKAARPVPEGAPAGTILSSELDHLSAEIAAWYDQATDRFAGWYKQKLQIVTLVISAFLCIGLNADTAAIARALSGDATLRAGVVAYAESYAKTNPPAVQTNLPAPPATAKPAAPPSTSTDKITQDIQSLSQTVNKLDNLGIPLGWKEWPKHGEWPTKILGLLVTLLAVSLGAPFWFDVLSRFVNIRAAGNAPKKAADQAKI